MQKRLVEEENIELNVKAENWQEAVTAAGKVLVENDYVTDAYVDAMINAVKELGPYIVVAPGLAMPHAKSTNSVIKSGISIITLQSPVEFGNKSNDPVYMLVGVAGINDELHMDIIKAIATVFEEEEALKRLLESNSKKEIAEAFNQAALA